VRQQLELVLAFLGLLLAFYLWPLVQLQLAFYFELPLSLLAF